ncbi:MAG: choice-of-anchor D domain-containing protein, partial [Bacteroidota bacterium]
ISIESNDMGNPTVEVPVTLTVIDESTGAIIETDPENGETIDFGQVTIGESGDATVTISNVGDQPLIVAQFETSDETFSSDAALPLEIAPGESEEVTVSFTPDEEGVVNAELAILSNDTQDNDEIVIFLTGEGIEDVVDPSDLTFVLINATTDTPIGPVVDGDVVNLGDFPDNTTFNIEVLTGDLNARSVIFDFNGDNGFRTENVAPYALGGDRNGDFFGVNFPIGVNTVRATAFSGRRGTGDMLATETINIEFTPEGSQVPSAIDVILIDAGADTAIGSIEDGQVIDLANLDAVELSIEAIADFPSIGSVRFGLNGDANFRTENVAPYALNGDRSGDFNPINLLGENTLTVSVFQNRNGNGALLETITINFTVIDGAGALVQISPNPASDTVAVSSPLQY